MSLPKRSCGLLAANLLRRSIIGGSSRLSATRHPSLFANWSRRSMIEQLEVKLPQEVLSCKLRSLSETSQDL